MRAPIPGRHADLPWQWNFFVEYLPLWIAPNMVTLVGFILILANVGLANIYMPDLIGPAPSWVYFSFAFGLFMYQTLDNVDGKQARRTGTSSPLGELFDHGIDALNCALAGVLQTAAMGLGTSNAGIITALSPCLAFFFSTWETYHTHTLYLGFVNGPVEGILIGCAIMVASGIWGPQIWTQPLGGTRVPGAVGQLSFRDIWILLFVGSIFVAHIPFCLANVAKARRANGLPVLPLLIEWVPMAVFTFATSAWVFSPYSSLMEENHLVLFCMMASLVFGRFMTKIILAHLTRQPFPYWTSMLTPLVVGAVLVNLPRLGLPQISAVAELFYLRAAFLFCLVVYFYWAHAIIAAICKFLGINALTIPKGLPTTNRPD